MTESWAQLPRGVVSCSQTSSLGEGVDIEICRWPDIECREGVDVEFVRLLDIDQSCGCGYCIFHAVRHGAPVTVWILNLSGGLTPVFRVDFEFFMWQFIRTPVRVWDIVFSCRAYRSVDIEFFRWPDIEHQRGC